jgi:hypothetical protein
MNLSEMDIPAPPTIEIGKYRHYKGNEYEVVGVAMYTETLEPLVIYKPLHEAVVGYWVRPYEMFVDNVTVDGKSIQRFERID